MKDDIDISQIRKQWQPIAGRDLSDNDCQKISGDIGLFFSALQRMKAELDSIHKVKKGEEND